MKKAMLFVGAVAVVLALAACQDAGSSTDRVGVHVQRPGNPGGVTLSVSPCQSWAIIAWTVGANADGHEIFKQQSGAILDFEPVTPVTHLQDFFAPLHRPVLIDGPRDMSNAPLGWIDTATLVWHGATGPSLVATPTVNRNRVSAVIPLTVPSDDIRGGATFRVGVRSTGVFDHDLTDYSHSPIIWASGTPVFRNNSTFALGDININQILTDLAGTSGQVVNMVTRAQDLVVVGYHITGAMAQRPLRGTPRWDIAAVLPPDGPGLIYGAPTALAAPAPANTRVTAIPSVNGVFTPQFRGFYRVYAVWPYASTGVGEASTIRIAFTLDISLGTQFIPVTDHTTGPGGAPGQHMNMDLTPTDVPNQQVNTNLIPTAPGRQIIWTLRVPHRLLGTLTDPVWVPLGSPQTQAAGQAVTFPVPPIPYNLFSIQGTVINGRWWTPGLTWASRFFETVLPAPAAAGWTNYVFGGQRPIARAVIEGPVITVTNINWQGVGVYPPPVQVDGSGPHLPIVGHLQVAGGTAIDLAPATVYPAGRGVNPQIQWERQVRRLDATGATDWHWVPVIGTSFVVESHHGLAAANIFHVRARVVNQNNPANVWPGAGWFGTGTGVNLWSFQITTP